MHENSSQVGNGNALPALRRYCLCLVEFISSQATDPHLYFQHKLSADISAAENLADLMILLDYLISLIDSADLQSVQLIKLEKMLTTDALPSFSLIRAPANRELGRILAVGRVSTEQEYHLVRNSILETSEISSRDRILVEGLVMAYESRQ